MSALPGLGISLPPISTNAHAEDFGPSALNTPVNVVAGNGGGENLVQILDALAHVNEVQNQPALSALGGSSGGGLPSWVWLAGGAVLLFYILRRGH